MSRLLLIVVAVLLVVAAVAVLWLALLPPEPAPQRIERPPCQYCSSSLFIWRWVSSV